MRAHAAEHAAALARLSGLTRATPGSPRPQLRSRVSTPPPPAELQTTSVSTQLRTHANGEEHQHGPGDHWVTIDGKHVMISEAQGSRGQQGSQTPPVRQTRPTPQELAKKIPPQIRAEMARAIDDSNRPTADDKKGGFHEEVGVAGLDASGKWVVWREKPGPYANPDVANEVGVPRPVTDQNADYPVKDPKVFFHVHPSGTTETHTWNQPPSDADKSQIFAAGTYIVFGAREKNVYFYDKSGVIGKPMSLKDFLRQ